MKILKNIMTPSRHQTKKAVVVQILNLDVEVTLPNRSQDYDIIDNKKA